MILEEDLLLIYRGPCKCGLPSRLVLVHVKKLSEQFLTCQNPCPEESSFPFIAVLWFIDIDTKSVGTNEFAYHLHRGGHFRFIAAVLARYIAPKISMRKETQVHKGVFAYQNPYRNPYLQRNSVNDFSLAENRVRRRTHFHLLRSYGVCILI